MPTGLVTGRKRLAWSLVIELAAMGGALWGQAPANDADSSWFAGWQQRYAQLQTYEATPPPKLEDAAKRQAIGWLDREADYAARHFQNTGEGLSEDYGDYYIELTLFVARLKDPRSIVALTKVTDVSGRVSTTLAEFGEPAVQPVLRQLQSPLLRNSTVYTLGKFIEGNETGRCHIAESSVQTIRQALLEAVVDASPTTRVAAVNALKYFRRDTEVMRTIQHLASDDPYGVVRDPSTGKQIYPVRQAAAAALAEMGK
jgi:HEAT repeat protein